MTTLGLALAAAEVSDLALLCAVVLAGAVVALGFLFHAEKQRRVEAERAAAHARAAQQAGGGGGGGVDRDAVMFDQHRKINDLHIRKLEAEVSLLQGQVGSRADDADRLHAAKEFHELTVEKTKLEIDSLRLHIAEQRKRLDDFGLGGG